MPRFYEPSVTIPWNFDPSGFAKPFYSLILTRRINTKVMGKYKILVVDDEESLCEILKFNLELEGLAFV